jgi:hypothetical protein
VKYILIILVVIGLWFGVTTPVYGQTTPLISRDIPAFASSEKQPARYANDGNYDTEWESTGSAWLAYDLTSIPQTRRQMVIAYWFVKEHSLYDPSEFWTTVPPTCYSPTSFVIEGHSSTANIPPTNGWIELASVTSNPYSSYQQLLNLNGINWLRFQGVAQTTCPVNNLKLNLDLYEASSVLGDDWLFVGDSITNFSMNEAPISVSQVINNLQPNRYPILQNAGGNSTGLGSSTAALKKWLAVFPGKYVVIAYGMNNSGDNTSPEGLEIFY